MRLPGSAWLELSVDRATTGARCSASGRSSTRAGSPASAYWWSVAPFHGIVFGGMLRNITGAAERARAARTA